MAVLKRQEDEITGTITEIIQCIAELKKLLHYKDVCLVSEYKSRKDKFRRVLSKHKVSLPNFRSQEIHTDQLIEQFGYLTALDFNLENQDYIMHMPTHGTRSCFLDRSLLDVR